MSATAPIFTARVYREFVEVSFGKDKEKVLTVNDFVNVLNSHVGVLKPAKATEEKEETGSIILTPRSFFAMKSNTGRKNVDVLMYREEHRGTLMIDQYGHADFFKAVFGGTPDTSKEVAERYKIAGVTLENKRFCVHNVLMPNFLVKVPLTLSADKKQYAIGTVLYGVTDVPREGLKATGDLSPSSAAKLMCRRPPYPNFYEGGTMCYGGNQVLVNIANDGNFRPLEYYMSLIEASPFSFHVMPRRYPNRFNGTDFLKRIYEKTSIEDVPKGVRDSMRNYDNYTKFLHFITDMAQPTAKFPYEEFKNEGD